MIEPEYKPVDADTKKEVYIINDDDQDWVKAGKEVMNRFPGLWRNENYPKR